MKRTTIMAPEELLDQLRAIADDEGISLGEAIRQGLELRAAQHCRRPRFIASGRSTERPHDAGRRAGDLEYLPRSWR